MMRFGKAARYKVELKHMQPDSLSLEVNGRAPNHFVSGIHPLRGAAALSSVEKKHGLLVLAYFSAITIYW